ncbi:MAG: FG-GAP repeat protein, partial [Planctomycetes bacterium]|nr:FG-GAP repeat protein [Planctomycetota bacterium]
MSSHLLTSTMVVALLAPNLAWANEHSEHTEPAADGVPQGLTLDDWQSIRDAHDAYRLGVRAVEGGHTAHNPAQGWTTRFDARGFELRPAGGEWSWGLDLSSYGRESCETSPDVRRDVTVEGVRLEYHWDDLMTEWYVNEARGLEHGYTLHARPEGEGELELRIAVRGTLRPTVESGGRDVRFSDSSGRTRLVYAGLVVFDAGGRRLDAGFTLAADELLLTVDDEGARYPITIDPLAQLGYLKASNTQAQDIFGNQVAISGDTVVVAAPTEDSGATGVNGDQTFDSASGSGAAYVFVRTGPVWSQQAYLKASNTSPDDLFGISLGISGDTIVVGASLESSSSTGVDGNQSNSGATGSGAAYVFVRAGGTWSQQAFLKASNTDAGDHFGDSVAVSGDTIVVGAYSESSDAVGVNGIETSNSADEAGAAYVFVRQGTSWSQEAYLKASNTEAFDQFGKAVGVSGDTIAVGAILEA